MGIFHFTLISSLVIKIGAKIMYRKRHESIQGLFDLTFFNADFKDFKCKTHPELIKLMPEVTTLRLCELHSLGEHLNV